MLESALCVIESTCDALGASMPPAEAPTTIISWGMKTVLVASGGAFYRFDEGGCKYDTLVARPALGYSNKEIATRLSLSVKTVEVHKANAMRRLNIHQSHRPRALRHLPGLVAGSLRQPQKRHKEHKTFC